MRAVILEFPDEAEWLLEECRRKGISTEPQELTIVALTPAVRAFLQTRSVPCRTTLPYFDTAAHRRVQLERENIIRGLEDCIRIPDGYVVHEAYKDSVISYFRLFLGYLMKHAEILHQVQQDAPVKEWIACRFDGESEGGGLPILTLRERYAGRLTRAFAAARSLPCVELRMPPLASASPAVRRTPILDRLIRHLYFWLYRWLADSPTAIVNHLGYEMDVLITEIARAYPDVTWFWIDTDIRDGSWIELKKCLIRMFRIAVRRRKGPFSIPLPFLAASNGENNAAARRLSDDLFRQIQAWISSNAGLFCYRSVPLDGLLLEKSKLDLIPFQDRIHDEARALDRLLETLRPRFVLSHSSEDGRCALGELCARRGIPAVLITHGSHVPSDELAARIEHDRISRRLMNSTYPLVAIQSRWSLKYADIAGLGPERRLLTGPLIWTRLRHPSGPRATKWLAANIPAYRPGRSKVVLFVCASSQRQSCHLFFPESQDENIQSVADVLQAVAALEDAVLVVRHRFQHLCSPNDLAALLPSSDRMAIHFGGRFSEALALADLVVSFSSTAIEEALCNGIPVLLYGGGGRYCHIPAPLIDAEPVQIASAVYWVNDKACLKMALKHVLQHHPMPLDPALLRPHCIEANETTPLFQIIGSFLSRSGEFRPGAPDQEGSATVRPAQAGADTSAVVISRT